MRNVVRSIPPQTSFAARAPMQSVRAPGAQANHSKRASHLKASVAVHLEQARNTHAWGQEKLQSVTGAVKSPPWTKPTPYVLEYTPARLDVCALPLAESAVAAARVAHAALSASCSSSSLRVRVFEAGFFATLHGVLADVLGAAAEHRHIVFEPLSVWSGPDCKHLACYLAAGIRPCNLSKPYVESERHTVAMQGRAPSRRVAMSFDRFSHAAALMARLVVPSRWIAREMTRAKALLGWDVVQRPIIGVHVRDGDSCNSRERAMTHRTCGGLKAFMPRVKALAERYKVRTIFLATDGKRVINETARYPEFKWLVLPRERFLVGAGAESEPRMEQRIASGTLDGRALALESLVDMMLLAETDVLIGKFTSNLFRSAFELRAGRRGCVPPIVSMDAAWCFGPDHVGGENSGEVLRGRHAGETFAC